MRRAGRFRRCLLAWHGMALRSALMEGRYRLAYPPGIRTASYGEHCFVLDSIPRVLALAGRHQWAHSSHQQQRATGHRCEPSSPLQYCLVTPSILASYPCITAAIQG